jgi:hypothetical protein
MRLSNIHQNAVDENLYYKGVDKSAVHMARLHQTHSLTEPIYEQSKPAKQSAESDESLPPYPYTSGDTLLALTKKHNVRSSLTLFLGGLRVAWQIEDNCSDRSRQ